MARGLFIICLIKRTKTKTRFWFIYYTTFKVCERAGEEKKADQSGQMVEISFVKIMKKLKPPKIFLDTQSKLKIYKFFASKLLKIFPLQNQQDTHSDVKCNNYKMWA